MITRKKLIYLVLLLLLILVGVVVATFISDGAKENKEHITNQKTSTQNNLGYKQTVSDGILNIPIPSSFGLAVNKDQILVHSYIPPCGENFDYCIYYLGKAYEGTNFESAGIRIQKRNDLNTKSTCMNTEPVGYADLKAQIKPKDGYFVSTFGPISEGAVGHYSNGFLYRLFSNDKCYELETRIGQSQFMNYPAGTINKFTQADQKALEAKLKQVIDAISLPSGVKGLF